MKAWIHFGKAGEPMETISAPVETTPQGSKAHRDATQFRVFVWNRLRRVYRDKWGAMFINLPTTGRARVQIES